MLFVNYLVDVKGTLVIIRDGDVFNLYTDLPNLQVTH